MLYEHLVSSYVQQHVFKNNYKISEIVCVICQQVQLAYMQTRVLFLNPGSSYLVIILIFLLWMLKILPYLSLGKVIYFNILKLEWKMDFKHSSISYTKYYGS